MPILHRIAWATTCAAAMFCPQLATADAPAFTVKVLDTLILGETKTAGLKINELSGLAYDAQSGRVYAVSDQGRLFIFALDLIDDRIAGLKPVSGFDLVDSDGRNMADQGFNAEGLALTGDGTLTILSEKGPRIAKFSAEGKWLKDVPAPSELRDPTKQRGKNNGLEALALHPDFGVLTAPEQPLASEPRTTHTIYSTSGRSFVYDTAEIGETNVKGLETLPDGSLMVLERAGSSKDGNLLPWLRLIDPAACTADQICATQAAKVEIPGIADANFEGLAQLSPQMFLIVSDDKIRKEHRSVFALVKVTLPSQEPG